MKKYNTTMYLLFVLAFLLMNCCFVSGQYDYNDNYQVAVEDLREGGYIMLDGRPCRIEKIETSDAGYLTISGVDIVTQEQHVDRIPPAVVVDVPNVSTSEYRLIGIDEDGYLSLVDSKGQSDQVLTLPAGELRDEISDIFGKNENTTIYVHVVSAAGRKYVVKANVG